MKCNIPLSHRTDRKSQNIQAMRMFFIFAGYILPSRFGFSDAKLKQFQAAIGEFFGGEIKNDTLADEAEAWARKHNFFADKP